MVARVRRGLVALQELDDVVDRDLLVVHLLVDAVDLGLDLRRIADYSEPWFCVRTWY